jgi:hypothetical protein
MAETPQRGCVVKKPALPFTPYTAQEARNVGEKYVELGRKHGESHAARELGAMGVTLLAYADILDGRIPFKVMQFQTPITEEEAFSRTDTSRPKPRRRDPSQEPLIAPMTPKRKGRKP